MPACRTRRRPRRIPSSAGPITTTRRRRSVQGQEQPEREYGPVHKIGHPPMRAGARSERRIRMRLSTLRAQQGRSLVGKIVLALTVAAVLGGLAAGPALSEDHDRRDRPQERDRQVHSPRPAADQPYRLLSALWLLRAPPVALRAAAGRLCPAPVAGHQPFLRLPDRALGGAARATAQHHARAPSGGRACAARERVGTPARRAAATGARRHALRGTPPGGERRATRGTPTQPLLPPVRPAGRAPEARAAVRNSNNPQRRRRCSGA